MMNIDDCQGINIAEAVNRSMLALGAAEDEAYDVVILELQTVAQHVQMPVDGFAFLIVVLTQQFPQTPVDIGITQALLNRPVPLARVTAP